MKLNICIYIDRPAGLNTLEPACCEQSPQRQGPGGRASFHGCPLPPFPSPSRACLCCASVSACLAASSARCACLPRARLRESRVFSAQAAEAGRRALVWKAGARLRQVQGFGRPAKSSPGCVIAASPAAACKPPPNRIPRAPASRAVSSARPATIACVHGMGTSEHDWHESA